MPSEALNVKVTTILDKPELRAADSVAPKRIDEEDSLIVNLKVLFDKVAICSAVKEFVTSTHAPSKTLQLKLIFH